MTEFETGLIQKSSFSDPSISNFTVGDNKQIFIHIVYLGSMQYCDLNLNLHKKTN